MHEPGAKNKNGVRQAFPEERLRSDDPIQRGTRLGGKVQKYSVRVAETDPDQRLRKGPWGPGMGGRNSSSASRGGSFWTGAGSFHRLEGYGEKLRLTSETKRIARPFPQSARWNLAPTTRVFEGEALGWVARGESPAWGWCRSKRS